MENLQISVDKNHLPLYIPLSNLETDLISRNSQEEITKALQYKTPSNFSPLSSAKLEECDQSSAQGVDAFVPGTNVAFSLTDDVCEDIGRSKRELSSLFLNGTFTRTQNEAKDSGGANLFWESMLQAQLCVMELQDEIDKKERQWNSSETFHSEERSSVDPSIVDQVDDMLEETDLEQGHENEENFFEDEIQDESLFYENPLFQDFSTPHSDYPTLQTNIDMRNNPMEFISSVEYSAKEEVFPCDQTSPSCGHQALWGIKDHSTKRDLENQIIHAESLEILQIVEEDWEETNPDSYSTMTEKWCVSPLPLCIQESPPRPETPSPPEGDSVLYTVPEVSPSLEASVSEEGLLFSPSRSSLVSSLLMENDSDLSLQSPVVGLHVLHIQDVSAVNDLQELPVCLGCQGKEQVDRTLAPEVKKEDGDVAQGQNQNCRDVFTEQTNERTTEKEMETSGSEEASYGDPGTNSHSQDFESAKHLAKRLFNLDGFERSKVAPYLQENSDFGAKVAEQYLSLFDFTGKSLDVALRSLLQELVLTGETQERERVLLHFSNRFHKCNPQRFGSSDAVHTLTCAIMLLNSDLHGQNIGKCMSLQDFINNLDGMNDGTNFPKEILKALYNSIRNEKLEWAVSEEQLANTLVPKPENLISTRKKSNPFLEVAMDPGAPTYKQGMLPRKVHADIDGKRTPWGRRGWKSFYTVLKGLQLIFLKDEYRSDWKSPEDVISLHHSMAEKANEYTKKQNVFRLQTADWRVFLFQAPTSEEMNSWIHRINLVAAMFSSPPFPAAIGSQKKFVRPILPFTPSKLDLEEQLQSHETWMDTFTDDLTEHLRNLPDGKSKTRDWEDYHVREEYLRYEKSRYEIYVKMLALRLQFGSEDMNALESLLTEPDGTNEENGDLKRSHSSPSLNVQSSPMVIKVKRNISERRTYRRIIPKRNKNLV